MTAHTLVGIAMRLFRDRMELQPTLGVQPFYACPKVCHIEKVLQYLNNDLLKNNKYLVASYSDGDLNL